MSIVEKRLNVVGKCCVSNCRNPAYDRLVAFDASMQRTESFIFCPRDYQFTYEKLLNKVSFICPGNFGHECSKRVNKGFMGETRCNTCQSEYVNAWSRHNRFLD